MKIISPRNNAAQQQQTLIRTTTSESINAHRSSSLLSMTNVDDDNDEDDEDHRRRPPKTAFAVSICAGTDYRGASPLAQLKRLYKLITTLNAVNSTIPRILLSAGYNRDKLNQIFLSWKSNNNNNNNTNGTIPFRGMDDIVYVDLDQLQFQMRTVDDGLWPMSNRTQARTDGRCTALKLWAWNLTHYDAIYHSDTDVCFRSAPDRHVKAFVTDPSRPLFRAICEVASREWNMGVNTHQVLLRPNSDMFALLKLKAATGYFVGYTNTEQDVLETVFTPLCIPSNQSHVYFAQHEHNRTCPKVAATPDTPMQ